MSHPVFFHDQTLAYIKNDAMNVTVDGQNSFELLAREFQFYWRSFITEELTLNMQVIEQVHGPISKQIQREIFKIVWTPND
jgi:hypothetical protein